MARRSTSGSERAWRDDPFAVRCDTCLREVQEVSRVVITLGYNKVSAKAIYNCAECFSKKEQTKSYNQPATSQAQRPSNG